MRECQKQICQAIIKKRDWGGSNVVVTTINNVTKISFYGSVIGLVDHNNRTAKCDNCGYCNACTTARINAIIMACNELKYKVTRV